MSICIYVQSFRYCFFIVDMGRCVSIKKQEQIQYESYKVQSAPIHPVTIQCLG